jgi:ABC-2 type transport system ATP-binding protein
VMDEASRCDRLGLIRFGRLLAQGTSGELIAKAGTEDLEGAFLALSAVTA